MPTQPRGQDAQPDQGVVTGIRLRLQFLPINHVFASAQPVVELDDQAPVALRWGDTFIPTDAGTHRLRCSFRYTVHPRAGDASTSVVVPEGQVVELTYDAPKVMAFNAGSWRHGIDGALSNRSNDRVAGQVDESVDARPSPSRALVVRGSTAHVI